MWQTLLPLSFVLRFIAAAVAMSRVLGITFLLAVIADTINVLTFHVLVLYSFFAWLHRVQVRACVYVSVCACARTSSCFRLVCVRTCIPVSAQ